MVTAPPEAANPWAMLGRLPEFTVLRAALRQAALVNAVDGPEPVTLLAPRDTAFARLGKPARAALLDPAATSVLRTSLATLIVPRVLRGDELRTLIVSGGGRYVTLASNGRPLTFTLSGDYIVVTGPGGLGATIGTTESSAGNGVVYVLDGWIG